METIIYEKICIVCGNDFTAKRYTAKTCSQKCRNILHISRKIAGNINAITDDILPVTTPVMPENTAITPINTDVVTLVKTKDNNKYITDLKQLIGSYEGKRVRFDDEKKGCIFIGLFKNEEAWVEWTKKNGRENDLFNIKIIETKEGYYFFEHLEKELNMQKKLRD